jgi:hypothetical protein
MRMMRKRAFILGLLGGLVLLLTWHVALADVPRVSHPAHRQVYQIIPDLLNSEAEYATGAYIPTIGAVITMNLIRGPNTLADKPSYEGTRDWVIYLMQTFGPRLTEVPPTEAVAISVDFYDYAQVGYYQLVVTSRAADVADPSKYSIWLNGKPYDEVLREAATASSGVAVEVLPTLAPTATLPLTTEPIVLPTIAATPTLTPTASPTPAPAAPTVTPTPGPVDVALDFNNPRTLTDWTAIGGQWVLTDSGYAQVELNRFDLISFFSRPISGDFTLQADTIFVEGKMGAGLIFNAPTNTGKEGAQMVSYAGAGSFIQWGYFNEIGVFQFQGGRDVVSGADGKPHTLSVRVTGESYEVSLDGQVLAQGVPLQRPAEGYAGLLASTSHVTFDNVSIKSNTP